MIEKEIVESTAKYLYFYLKSMANKNHYDSSKDFVRHVLNEINRLNNEKGD